MRCCSKILLKTDPMCVSRPATCASHAGIIVGNMEKTNKKNLPALSKIHIDKCLNKVLFRVLKVLWRKKNLLKFNPKCKML